MKFEPVKVKNMAIAMEIELIQPFTGFVLFLVVLSYHKIIKWNLIGKSNYGP